MGAEPHNQGRTARTGRPHPSPSGLTGRDLRSTARVRRARRDQRRFAEAPRIHAAASPIDGADLRAWGGRLAKRTIDVVGASVLLLLCLPVLLAIAILVKLSSPGPVLYRQDRVGRDGRTFAFLKFRTMIDGADLLRDELLDKNDCDGILFKMRSDPRVTPIGRRLRRFSLDELPQLLHVLLGHMSLVGPRPPLPIEVETYDPVERRRLAVKPGLTGLWQVSGRSNLSWDESIELDLHYVDNWSLLLDLRILVRTMPAVVTARGAY